MVNAQFGKICPACGYRRQPTDQAEQWRCPRCLAVYAKLQVDHQHQQALHRKQQKIIHHYRLIQNDKLFALARCIEVLLLLSFVLLALAFIEKGKLPMPVDMSPQLLREPVQVALNDKPYHFEYRGNRVDVKPIAHYELRGLIVSHNDIDGFIDGYDPDSVNLKDICVIWGSNIETPIYHQVEFNSRTWLCEFSYPPSVRGLFKHHQLSNTHLISPYKEVREAIRSLRIGDQVYLKGQLVDYYTPKINGWRRSSVVRTDTGNGACEVMLVDEVHVLAEGTPGWYRLYELAKILILICIMLRVALQFVDCKMGKS